MPSRMALNLDLVLFVKWGILDMRVNGRRCGRRLCLPQPHIDIMSCSIFLNQRRFSR
jgi:hypothetical protein